MLKNLFVGSNKYIIIASFPLIATMLFLTVPFLFFLIVPFFFLILEPISLQLTALTLIWVSVVDLTQSPTTTELNNYILSQSNCVLNDFFTSIKSYFLKAASIFFFIISPLCISFLSLWFSSHDVIVADGNMIKNLTTDITTHASSRGHLVGYFMYTQDEYMYFIKKTFDIVPYTILLLIFMGILISRDLNKRNMPKWGSFLIMLFSIAYLYITYYTYVHAVQKESAAWNEYLNQPIKPDTVKER